MKKIEKPKRVQQSDEELRVDVYNDAEMVALGMRVPPLAPRDPSVWTKTPSEKFILKRERARDKTEFLTRWAGKKKSIPVYDKLIVRLHKAPKGGKNTLSIKCGQSDIPKILARYKDNVVNYSWNGKTYTRTSLPFWGR